MKDRTNSLAVFCTLLFFSVCGAGAHAQNTGPGGSQRYVLTQSGGVQDGCVPPCLCGVAIGVDFAGTFDLTPTGTAGTFETFSVQNVDWAVTLGGFRVPITGSGTYRIDRSGVGAPLQQLELDVQVGGEPVEHLDSGLVDMTVGFPAIDITTLHIGDCRETIIRVSAEPLLATVSVPAVSTFGLIALALLVVGAGARILRRTVAPAGNTST